jgi:hypothetical protein
MHDFASLPAVLVAFAPSLLGCSDDPAAPTCAGISSPAVLELAELTPAVGATVPNDDIVHSFLVTGDVAFTSIAFAYSKAHDAGKASPELELSYSQEDDGVLYTAEPTTWENAPGHVEMAVPVVYETSEGCGYRLPFPLFSYDVTAP